MRGSHGIGLALGLVLAGCGSSVAPADAQVADAQVEDAQVAIQPDAAVAFDGPSAIGSCTPTLAAFTPHGPIYATPVGYLGSSPNDGLVLDSVGSTFNQAIYHRASTGEGMFDPPERYILSRDSSWTRDARFVTTTDANGSTTTALEVVTTVTNRTVLRVDAPTATMQWEGAALDPSGAVLYASVCLDDHLLVRGWDVDTRAEIGSASIPGACTRFGSATSALAPTTTRGLVFVGHTALGELHRVDLAASQTTHIVAHPPSTDPNESFATALIAVTLSPDGTRVFTSGADTVVRVWDAADLHALGPALPASIGYANLNVYANPFAVSPIAITSAGDLVAHAGPNGSVVLRASDSQAVVANVPDPTPMESGVVPHGAPLGLAFARDGSYLIASYTSGLAIFTCRDHVWPADHHNLQVTLEGPQSMSAGAVQTFLATHFGTDHVHAHRFFVDGTLVDQPGFARELAWTAIVGTHAIEVEVDDGIDTGRASLEVNVSP